MDASQIPLSLSSLPLCLAPHSFVFFGTTRECAPEEDLKKKPTGASNLHIVAADAAPTSPLKSPRRSVAGRSESLRFFGAFFPSLWQLTAKKRDSTHPRYFLQPGATTPLSCSWSQFVCACVLARAREFPCVCACVFISFFFPPPASLFNSLFVYYRLQRGAVIQFCNHQTGGGGGQHPAWFFWMAAQ